LLQGTRVGRCSVSLSEIKISSAVLIYESKSAENRKLDALSFCVYVCAVLIYESEIC